MRQARSGRWPSRSAAARPARPDADGEGRRRRDPGAGGDRAAQRRCRARSPPTRGPPRGVSGADPAGPRSVEALDDAEVALDAAGERGRRLLVGRALACRDGLFEAVELDQDGALGESGLVRHDPAVTGEDPAAPGRPVVGGRLLRVRHGAVDADPVALGHGTSSGGRVHGASRSRVCPGRGAGRCSANRPAVNRPAVGRGPRGRWRGGLPTHLLSAGLDPFGSAKPPRLHALDRPLLWALGALPQNPPLMA